MTTVCFSIMHINRYKNAIEVILQGTQVTKQDLVTKLLTIEQSLLVSGQVLSEPQIALRA